MRLLYTLIFSAIVFASYSQISLEHTFSSTPTWINSPNGVFWAVVDYDKSHVMIYDDKYSVKSSISLNPRNGYSPYQMSAFSTDVFNDDDDVEFFISFKNDTSSTYYALIMNEKGNSIADLNEAYFGYFILNAKGNKLITYSSPLDPSFEVYSLPTKAKESDAEESLIMSYDQSNKLNVFPIPSSDFIQVTTSTDGLFSITDLRGVTVFHTYIIGGLNPNNINISVLSPGVYIYEKDNFTGKLIVE